jgi:hypothetical protein
MSRTLIRYDHENWPYVVVARRYPEQKRRGHAKKKWSLNKSAYAFRGDIL